jgi:hypothetical protein
MQGATCELEHGPFGRDVEKRACHPVSRDEICRGDLARNVWHLSGHLSGAPLRGHLSGAV